MNVLKLSKMTGLLALLCAVAGAASAQTGSIAQPAKEMQLPPCNKHEPNVQDCHVHDRDTFLHLWHGNRPDGLHAKAEMRNYIRKERSDRH